MKGGHRSPGTKPGVNGDLVLLPVAQAAVVGNTDVPLQLRDLGGQSTRGGRALVRDAPAPKSTDHLTGHTLPLHVTRGPRLPVTLGKLQNQLERKHTGAPAWLSRLSL